MDESLDKKIDEALKPVSDFITNFIFDSFSFLGSDVPYIVCWLLIASLFFTFYYNSFCNNFGYVVFSVS